MSSVIEKITYKIASLPVVHAAGLALTYAFCASNGMQFPEFVAGALFSGITYDSIQGFCVRANEGASSEELQEQAENLAEIQDGRALEELTAVVGSVSDKIDSLPQQMRDEMFADLQREQKSRHEELLQEQRRVLAVVSEPAFEIVGTVAKLLASVDMVRGHGLAYVVDRPESEAISNAFKNGPTKHILLKGRALSGKTFLSFKVAQRWIVSGGLVAWMNYGANISNYIGAIKHGVHDSENLPLLVWDLPFDSGIDKPIFEVLKKYQGAVLTTVRIGDLNKEPASFKALEQTFGFKPAGWAEGDFNPKTERSSMFLGPISNPGAVLSAIGNAHNYSLTLTEDGRNTIIQSMGIGHGTASTTLLGLGKAYLMALRKQGVRHVDRQAVWQLEGPDREKLKEEELVGVIFGQTVDAAEKNFLSLFNLYKAWTFSKGIHQDVLTSALQAYRQTAHIHVDDKRDELVGRGVLLRTGPYYWPWHDLQLDVAPPVGVSIVRPTRLLTTQSLAQSLDAVIGDQNKASMALGSAGFAAELQKCGHWNEALTLYKAVLRTHRDLAVTKGAGEEQKRNLAMTCNNLGASLADMGQRQEAKSLYEEALKSYRELAEEQPRAYRQYVATTCNNLGALLADMGQHQEAKDLYEEALRIRRDLAKYQPQAYRPDVAMTSNNLGNLLADMGQGQEAKDLYEEALEIYRELAKEQPRAYRQYLAMTCNNLGNLLANMGQRQEAKDLYEEALEIYRELAEEQPRAYRPRVAMTCNNQGLLLANLGLGQEAKDLYEEALEIYRKLAVEQPRAYRQSVAMTCNNLGLLLANLGLGQEAKDLYEEALETYRKLAEEQPRAYRQYVALACNNLGNLLANMGQRQEAKDLYEEALEIYRELAKEQPRAYRQYVATTYNNLGTLLADIGQHQEAKDLYEEALEIYRELAKEHPRAYWPDVAKTCNNLGALLADMGQHQEVKDLHEEALEIYRELAKEQPRAYRQYVATTYNNLGNLLADMGQRQEAKDLYEEALETYRELAKEQPRAYQQYVAMTCNNLGALLADMGQYQEAANILSEALALHYLLFEDQPQLYGQKVSTTLSAIHRLAGDKKFSDRNDWLEALWAILLERFQMGVLQLCTTLGYLFQDVGFPNLSLEPSLLLAMALEKMGDPEAAKALEAVEGLETELGDAFEPMCQTLREKFAPLLESIEG